MASHSVQIQIPTTMPTTTLDFNESLVDIITLLYKDSFPYGLDRTHDWIHFLNVLLYRFYSITPENKGPLTLIDILAYQTQEEWAAHSDISETEKTQSFYLNMIKALHTTDMNPIFFCMDLSEPGDQNSLPITLNSKFRISMKKNHTPFSKICPGFTQEHKHLFLRFNKLKASWSRVLTAIKDLREKQELEQKDALHPSDLLPLMQVLYFYKKDHECPWDDKYLGEWRRRVMYSYDFDIFSSWSGVDWFLADGQELQDADRESSCLTKAALSFWGVLEFFSYLDPTTHTEMPILHKKDPRVIQHICRSPDTNKLPSLSALEEMVIPINRKLDALQSILKGAFPFTPHLDFLISAISISMLHLVKIVHLWFRTDYYQSIKEALEKTFGKGLEFKTKWDEIEEKMQEIWASQDPSEQQFGMFASLQKEKQALLQPIENMIHDGIPGNDLELDISQLDMLHQAKYSSSRLKIHQKRKGEEVSTSKKEKVKGQIDKKVSVDSEADVNGNIDPESGDSRTKTQKKLKLVQESIQVSSPTS